MGLAPVLCSSATRSRVELVPTSIAATLKVRPDAQNSCGRDRCYAWTHAIRPAGPGEHHRSHGIRAVAQLMRYMRVKALDPLRPSAGLGNLPEGLEPVPVSTVSRRRRRDPASERGIRFEPGGELRHTPARLLTARSFHEQGAGQPEGSGKGRAVLQPWMVLDDHRHIEMTDARDLPAPSKRSPELCLYKRALLLGMRKIFGGPGAVRRRHCRRLLDAPQDFVMTRLADCRPRDLPPERRDGLRVTTFSRCR